MDIIKTKTGRTHARVRYDLISEITKGDIYTNVGGETYIGYVTDEVPGTATFHILPEFAEKEYIKQDCEELRPKFANESNFWAAKQSYTKKQNHSKK